MIIEYLCLRIIMHLGPTHFTRISKITTRQASLLATYVNVANNDNIRITTVVNFISSIVNILSSDYCSVLILYRKFEESCKMLWYNFHND